MSLALVVFWVAVAILVYAYAGFPVLLALVATLRPRRVRQAPVTPSLSLVIAAYNEEQCIADRLENALAGDYPRDALEIIVASDGSTDRTEAIVRTFADRGDVRLLALPRRGKLAALVEGARAARGEILVFSDANSDVAPTAFRALARNFADPAVGGVVGHTGYRVPRGAESSGQGEDLYWRYDTWLKQLESRTGSVVSAHGGLYAIRRALFRVPRDAAVTDDFIISTAVVAQGRRLVFEPEARAWEQPTPSAKREFSRRIRLMTRGMRGVWLRRGLLNPMRHGTYATVLFTHKVVRRLLFIPLLAILATTAVLSVRSGAFALLLAAQLAFYVLAGIGFALRRSAAGRFRPLYVPFFYCMANTASAIAFVRFLRGERIVSWHPQRHATHA